MSYRRVWALIQQLPQESRTQTILRDKHFDELVSYPATERPDEPEKFGPWALINYQLAALTDAINAVWYATAVGKFEKVTQLPPTPRPGMERRPRGISHSPEAEAARRYLDEFNRGVAA